MPDKRRFEVFENPLLALEKQITQAGMIFYRVDEVPFGSTPIWVWQRPENLFEETATKMHGMNLRQECDVTIGEEQWAVTPSTDKAGESIDGLIDIVTVSKSSEPSPKSRKRAIEQVLARPALRLAKGPTDQQ